MEQVGLSDFEIQKQALIDHVNWINKIVNENKDIVLNKIKKETNGKLQVRKMRTYELRGKEVSFIAGK